MLHSLLATNAKKISQDSLSTPEVQSSTQFSNGSQNDQHNNTTEALVVDSTSISVLNNDNRKVSREDIELVRHRCPDAYILYFFVNLYDETQ